MRSVHRLVSGFGWVVSEEWPLPARLLQLCFLSVEEIRVLIASNILHDEMLVVFSATAIGAPSTLRRFPHGQDLQENLVGRDRLQKELQSSFVDHILYSQTLP